jgi:hypothetical protein
MSEFSRFIHFSHLWNECLHLEDLTNQIRGFLDGQGLVMFFKVDKKLYGAPEESRVVFAKMKSSDDEVSDDWKNDANFMGLNLEKALEGVKAHNLFSMKDLEKIRIIEKEKMEKLLLKKAEKVGNKTDTIPPEEEPEPEKPPGMVVLKGKKEAVEGIKVWLDDLKDPKLEEHQQPFTKGWQTSQGAEPGMIWCKTVPEVRALIDQGIVKLIDFDNDLGLPEEGKHLARWIEEEAFNNTLEPIDYRIHSENPVGSEEIAKAMENAKKFWRQHGFTL